MTENEPGRRADSQPDGGREHDGGEDPGEDTAPLWWREASERSSYAEPQHAPSQGQEPAQDTIAWGNAADPYAEQQQHYGQQYGYDPYAYGGGYSGYAGGWSEQGWYAPPQDRRSGMPGWVWPVVAATALVVGLVGGALSGALVSSTFDSTPADSVFQGEAAAPAPLEPENGSVAAVAGALLPSTVQILTRGGAGPAGEGTGSGFVVDRDGHVITNNHVVSGVAEQGRIQVIDHRGRRHSATIVGGSATYDIAVLEIANPAGLRPAALGSSQAMNVGETVVAIGSPLGLGSTVTSGIVSALDRPVTTGDVESSSYINAVQTDAAINPGNSGGPLVNLRGEVVGVNSAIATMGGGFGGQGGNIGVGFAIPMEQVKITAAQIMRTGEAKYPVIGAEVNRGSRANGAEIVRVPADTPAYRGGLREGDIVVAIDGEPVTDGIGLIVEIRSHQPGETIELTVRRDGERRDVEITLDAKVG